MQNSIAAHFLSLSTRAQAAVALAVLIASIAVALLMGFTEATEAWIRGRG